MDKIAQAANLINGSKYIVAFTGAGVSVESGIPPFRGATGLWSRYDPNVLDLGYFNSQPEKAWFYIREIFYDFFGKARPNKAHEVLARMEMEGKLQCVITQNIDNLHQEAGSKVVHEFHGNSQTLVCLKCGRKYPVKSVDLSTIPPRCSNDNHVLKPDFIFFGEGIPAEAYQNSFNEADKADLFILIGTTGEVMPASYVPRQAKQNGCKIIEINPEESLYTPSITDVYIPMKAGEAFAALEKLLF